MPVDVETGLAAESGGGVTTDDDGFCCFWVVHRSTALMQDLTPFGSFGFAFGFVTPFGFALMQDPFRVVG